MRKYALRRSQALARSKRGSELRNARSDPGELVESLKFGRDDRESGSENSLVCAWWEG